MDISFAVFDPEPGRTGFTVDRITCTRSRSGITSRTVTVRARQIFGSCRACAVLTVTEL